MCVGVVPVCVYMVCVIKLHKSSRKITEKLLEMLVNIVNLLGDLINSQIL